MSEATATAEDPADCAHDWENCDDSFSHEFGTEIIRYRQCPKCGKREDQSNARKPFRHEP
jgi:transcriptional regulator NrdR family protein